VPVSFAFDAPRRSRRSQVLFQRASVSGEAPHALGRHPAPLLVQCRIDRHALPSTEVTCQHRRAGGGSVPYAEAHHPPLVSPRFASASFLRIFCILLPRSVLARRLYGSHALRNVLGRTKRLRSHDVGKTREGEQSIEVIAVSEIVGTTFDSRIGFASQFDLGFGGLAKAKGGLILFASASYCFGIVVVGGCNVGIGSWIVVVVVVFVVVTFGEFLFGSPMERLQRDLLKKHH